METLPTVERALKVRGSKEIEICNKWPLPVLEDDEILVRVRCVAMNRVDVEMVELAPKIGVTIVCQFSGDSVGLIRCHVGEESTQRYVLVYGGSSVCGAMALQLLRNSGFIPVSTCSPQIFALVKDLGAEEPFDYNYRSPTCGEDIRRFTANTLTYVLDCTLSQILRNSTRIHYAAIGMPVPKTEHLPKNGF
ncbi:hypothetical protein HYALB_00004687 [Hymenoscyphus albidus]|uniref:Uncharacterized protein n=1 Tax=Hymenoscyphus albidus TaxID=595503 RepID=A0A9N9Q866_9HELO|nr:hypothetical protein HYALB_00004687 [Hymenoscyphus albidus]